MTIQSFLRWFEGKVGHSVCVKMLSDGSGHIAAVDEDRIHLKFYGPADLYRKIKLLATLNESRKERKQQQSSAAATMASHDGFQPQHVTDHTWTNNDK